MKARSSDVCTALHVAAQAPVSVVSIVILSAPDFTKVNAVSLSRKAALRTAAGARLDDVHLAIILTSDFS